MCCRTCPKLYPAGGLGSTVRWKETGLLESALMRPSSSAFGHDAYPDLWSKAAAMLHSIIRNPPFLGGNKRTGVALALAFLDRNGEDVMHADPEAVIDLAVGIANSRWDVAEITVALRLAVHAEGGRLP